MKVSQFCNNGGELQWHITVMAPTISNSQLSANNPTYGYLTIVISFYSSYNLKIKKPSIPNISQKMTAFAWEYHFYILFHNQRFHFTTTVSYMSHSTKQILRQILHWHELQYFEYVTPIKGSLVSLLPTLINY